MGTTYAIASMGHTVIHITYSEASWSGIGTSGDDKACDDD